MAQYIKVSNKLSPKEYERLNPEKARVIRGAVKRGLSEYRQTFKKLAST